MEEENIMDDASVAQQVAEGLFLIVGAIAPIPTAIVAGVTSLAGAAGYFFGIKHQQKRQRRKEHKEERDVINQILAAKEPEEDA